MFSHCSMTGRGSAEEPHIWQNTMKNLAYDEHTAGEFDREKQRDYQ